ncbi:MAG: GNAT family N-acetyltransferase [Lachnospiraceae bacterium]|nr:GNAT family N-acetyltransferase [Lachnospiraceae bacterium]
MNFRHLQSWEKKKSLPLYEEAFPEDQGAYAAYYYEWKSPDNEILVLTDTDAYYPDSLLEDSDHEIICAMLHLNPYNMWISTESVMLHYIVAVATALPFRRQGCMRKLMQKAFSWLYVRKEPFTYLMPADTAYYIPFGFRVIYDQKPVSFPADIDEANFWAKLNFDVVTLRNETYMRFLEAEPDLGQRYKTGDLKKDSGQVFESGVKHEPESWKPQIMCRIIHLPHFLECIRAQCRKKIYLRIFDPLIPDNSGFYCWQVDSESSHVTYLGKDISDRNQNPDVLFYEDGVEISSVFFKIEELAEQLFGVVPLHPSLEHLNVLSRICINEEV